MSNFTDYSSLAMYLYIYYYSYMQVYRVVEEDRSGGDSPPFALKVVEERKLDEAGIESCDREIKLLEALKKKEAQPYVIQLFAWYISKHNTVLSLLYY